MEKGKFLGSGSILLLEKGNERGLHQSALRRLQGENLKIFHEADFFTISSICIYAFGEDFGMVTGRIL